MPFRWGAYTCSVICARTHAPAGISDSDSPSDTAFDADSPFDADSDSPSDTALDGHSAAPPETAVDADADADAGSDTHAYTDPGIDS